MQARVVNKLKTVDMSSTNLTVEDMTRVMTRSLLTTNLKELDMEENGASRQPDGVMLLIYNGSF